MEKHYPKVVCHVVACTVVFLLLSSLCNAQEVIKLRYANFFAPTHWLANISDQWCKEVEKRTNGRVKVSHFTGGTLAAPPLVYSSLAKGSFDVAIGIFSYNTGRFPLAEVIDLPLGYRDGYQTTKMADAFLRKFRPALKEFDDTHMLYLIAPGPGLISTKKMISSLDEIKGMRIKSSGLTAQIVDALGAVPVAMPVTDAYDAFKKGLADGIIIHVEALQSFRFNEILKCTVQDFGMSNSVGMWVAMNKQKWNSLPKDIQQIIEKMNDEWVEKTAKAFVEQDKKVYENFKRTGSKVVVASKEQQAKTAAKMRPVLDDYVKRTKVKGLPGDEALKFCLDYLKNH